MPPSPTPADPTPTDPPLLSDTELGGTAKKTAGGTRAKSTAKDSKPKSGRGGARPGAGRPNRAAQSAKDDDLIRAALGQILFLPAVPCAMLGHPWPAQHFTDASPAFAATLTDASKTNPGLRRFLLAAAKGDSYAAMIIGTLGYALPPAIYFLAPRGAAVRGSFGIPDPPSQPVSDRSEFPYANGATPSPPAGSTGPAAPLADSQPG